MCSKSEWEPAVRREHAWAQVAASAGHQVTFIERPSDVRAVRIDGPASFAERWLRPAQRAVDPGVAIIRRSTLVPGHRSSAAAAVNVAGLRQVLRRASSAEASIVVNTPWDWRAVRKVRARRRIFDMADDWFRLMPGRERRFAQYFEEIAAEADEIVIVNPELSGRFPGRTPVVVRNGVSDDLLEWLGDSPVTPRTIVYLGTFSDRFDAPLMEATLQLLPGWRLDLIGPCLYGRLGSVPAPELEHLLRLDGRVRWHGPLTRRDALPWLDRAAVTVIPNRRAHSAGQDSMKFYDYAARGRPMVSTRWFSPSATEQPPHLLLADTAEAMAAAIVRAAAQSSAQREDRRAWAATRTWSDRWPQWSAAVFGEK